MPIENIVLMLCNLIIYELPLVFFTYIHMRDILAELRSLMLLLVPCLVGNQPIIHLRNQIISYCFIPTMKFCEDRIRYV